MPTRILLALAAFSAILAAQTPHTNVVSGRRYPRIVVRGAFVVDGSGTPMAGPKDIVIENNMITDVVASRGKGGGRQGISRSMRPASTFCPGSLMLMRTRRTSAVAFRSRCSMS
jgi:hypothetical protein